MYGNVELRIAAGERLVVPASAVLDSGRTQVVFVDGGEGRISPRDVRLGARFQDSVEVTEGLRAGDRIVTSGNFLVDSETKLQGAESMMGMMGAIGMGDMKMESARPMEMGAGQSMGGDAESADRRVGDLLVAVFPAAGAARVGEALIHVRVRDASGKPVTDATVSFNYTMDMPGMTIAESRAKPLGGGIYEGMARFTMGGPWGLVVEIARPGKPPVREKFNVRVGT